MWYRRFLRELDFYFFCLFFLEIIMLAYLIRHAISLYLFRQWKIINRLLFLSRSLSPSVSLLPPRLSLERKEAREKRRAFRFPAQKSVSPLETLSRLFFASFSSISMRSENKARYKKSMKDCMQTLQHFLMLEISPKFLPIPDNRRGKTKRE